VGRSRRASAAAVLAVAVVSGCASPAATGQPTAGGTSGATVTVTTRSLPDIGTVLVTGQGYALYMFAPDDRRAVTCTGVCAGTWPPLMLPSGAALAAGPGVKASLLGSDPAPGGGRVVTYGGWPLYTYTGDVDPGQATGQAIDLNGGEWYVLRPSGAPLVPGP
jgi:predicted lipoprotein with Yx(FWY)xxD motif